jgi:hypothetical protein
MKSPLAALLCLLGAVAVWAPSWAQEAAPAPASSITPCPAAAEPYGCHWTRDCFPRHGCPDDYCPNPFPRQCWPPYPPFYQCVPAGDCAAAGHCGPGKVRLTWWFLPTPRALCEALWCQP